MRMARAFAVVLVGGLVACSTPAKHAVAVPPTDDTGRARALLLTEAGTPDPRRAAPQTRIVGDGAFRASHPPDPSGWRFHCRVPRSRGSRCGGCHTHDPARCGVPWQRARAGASDVRRRGNAVPGGARA